MTVESIDIRRAQQLIAAGAVLVDVREPDEHAREHISGARHVPLSRMPGALNAAKTSMIFHCRSGSRTRASASELAGLAGGDAYILEGGLEAWKAAGLPTDKDASRPIELMRQVQIAAGSLILLGVGFGALVHSGFYALSGTVGAGLLFAGVTGTCGLGRLLALASWNRMPPSQQKHR